MIFDNIELKAKMHNHSNKTAVMTGISQLEIRSADIPELLPGEVLVKVISVGVCGSDVHFFESGRIGLDVLTFPHVLGHEASGTVVGHGDGVSAPPIGTLVAIEPSQPCGVCELCLRGKYNLCLEMRYLSAPGAAGAFTEYLSAPQQFVFPVPEGFSADEAALIEPLAVIVHAVKRANLRPGSRVLISGAGPIGLLAAQVTKVSGAAEVLVADLNEARLARAAGYGATAIDGLNLDSEVDAYFECSGVASVLASGIKAVVPGGVAIAVGMNSDPDSMIPLSLMQAREITLLTSFRFSNAFPEAIRLVANGKIDLDSLITGHFSLDSAQEALQAGRLDSGALKSIVRISE